jgi:Bacterial aa3 type cytochrome c oxidase subunit IV
MAGDIEATHETEPHEASFNSFWTFTKWGSVVVGVIVVFVILIIAR